MLKAVGCLKHGCGGITHTQGSKAEIEKSMGIGPADSHGWIECTRSTYSMAIAHMQTVGFYAHVQPLQYYARRYAPILLVQSN